MSNVEVIELSLIIDDNNTVSFKLDLNQADESAINSICEEIQEKYEIYFDYWNGTFWTSFGKGFS